MSPAISIILCTFNREDLLPRAIRSVLRQSFHDWELIIIDDGSRDHTKTLVQEFQNRDARIRYYYQTNKGLAKARNAGMKRARGEYICFVDSDDEIARDHLRKRLAYLQRRKEISFLHGGMKLIGPKKKHYVVDLTNPARKIHLRRCHIGGTFFFHKTILSKIPGFRAIPFGEDFDFFRRVEQLFAVKKVTYPTYRYHLDSADRLCDIFTDRYAKKNRRSTNT